MDKQIKRSMMHSQVLIAKLPLVRSASSHSISTSCNSLQLQCEEMDFFTCQVEHLTKKAIIARRKRAASVEATSDEFAFDMTYEPVLNCANLKLEKPRTKGKRKAQKLTQFEIFKINK